MFWKVSQTVAAIIGAVILSLVPLGMAQAAPLDQSCQSGAYRQHDMAGVFVSAYHQMRVEIYSCGGSYIRWTNQFGVHEALYYSTNPLPGGGVAATKMPQTIIALDGTNRIGFKPAEPGFIQVLTVTEYAEVRGVYRLQKIGPEPAY